MGPTCPTHPDLALRVDRPAEPDFNGTGYFQAASADLNDDGVLDLVVGRFHNVVDGGPGRIEVFLGLPDGGLAAPTHFVGSDGWTVVLADLDGDGLADVATSNFGRMSVFFNLGGGRLGPPTSFTFPNFQLGNSIGSPFIGVGDVNGDGRPDIVVSEYLEVYLMLNLGGRQFGEPQLLLHGPDPNPDLGESYRGVAVADLNGDGLGDIALSSLYGLVSVLLTQPDGGFERTFYGTPRAYFAHGVTSVGFGGSPDLVFGYHENQNGDWIGVLKNDGTGHFIDGGCYATQDEARWLLAVDLNGDCLPDVLSSGTVLGAGGSVMYRLPDGGFETPVLLVHGGNVEGFGAAILGPLGSPPAIGFVHEESRVITILGDSSQH